MWKIKWNKNSEKCDSLTSWHKITLDELTCRWIQLINQACILFFLWSYKWWHTPYFVPCTRIICMWSFTVIQLYYLYYWYTSYFGTSAHILIYGMIIYCNPVILPVLLIHPLFWNLHTYIDLCMWSFTVIQLYYLYSWYTPYFGTCTHILICVCDHGCIHGR